FFSCRRRHTRFSRDWSSDVCSSDLDRQPVDLDLRLDLLLRLFLLRVVRADLELPRRDLDADPAVLLVRQDRRTLQGGAQRLAVRSEERRVVTGCLSSLTAAGADRRR